MYKKKNVIIIVMCVCILLLAVGYATFQTLLNINGTASIESTWDVRFTSIVQSEKIGNASEKTAASYTERTATMDVNLDVPGDSITYLLTLTNSGNLDAIIENIDAKASGSSAIVYTLSGLKIGQKIKAGENIPITITIEYDKTVTSQPIDTTKKLTVNINVVQDLKQEITENDPIVEEYTKLYAMILGDNYSNVVTTGDGLYKSTDTNDGSPTYYYKGNVNNNCISFANQNWRIVRINEDGTIRVMMEYGINDISYMMNPTNNEFKYMYYTESNVEGGAMKRVNDWYTTNLSVYDSLIATSTFCEEARTKVNSEHTSGNATMTVPWNYKPTFTCTDDGNGHGLITNQKVGLITLDELLYTTSGSYDAVASHLKNGTVFWTMSPAGFDESNVFARMWRVWGDGTPGGLAGERTTYGYRLRPVINLVSDITTEDARFVTCPASGS